MKLKTITTTFMSFAILSQTIWFTNSVSAAKNEGPNFTQTTQSQAPILGESYIKTHTSLIQNVRKTAEIESILVTPENLEYLRDLNKRFCKEGPLPVELGFMFVLKNGTANPYYAMPKSEFDKKYIAHPNRKKDTYIATELRQAIKINNQFSVHPSWMKEGQLVTSEKQGGWLMIYGPNDYNICSFEDFSKTYNIVK
ncbi:TPA: hypothetical protein QCR51_005826 [Bacillus cereus]|nr:hypothetical protein [Bacillus cereus]